MFCVFATLFSIVNSFLLLFYCYLSLNYDGGCFLKYFLLKNTLK